MRFFFKLKTLFFFFIAFGILDVFSRLPYEDNAYFSIYSNVPTLFTISFILLLMAVFLSLPFKYRNRFIFISFIFYSILLIVHTVYKYHFGYYFSFKHLTLFNEGATYAHEYLNAINSNVILAILTGFILVLLILRFKIKRVYKPFIAIILLFSGICFNHAYINLGESTPSGLWFSNENSRDILDNFTKSNESFSIAGLYNYTAKDFQKTIIKNKGFNIQNTHNQINEYINNLADIDPNNEYTGLFEDKDLILIMLENIDTWMIDPVITPTMYQLQQSGINFTNHFAPIYALGNTFTTEFIANTGVIPEFNNSVVSYDFSDNDFSFALANLFKNEGYITNSYHTNQGSFYNRSYNHKAWGYDIYFDWLDLGIDGANSGADSYLVINGYEKIIHNEQYLNFIITFSGHMPFDITKTECSNNIEFVKQNINSNDESYLCALAQAHETDKMIEKLIERLKKDQKLDNTVLVLFSDHYAYSAEYSDLVSNLKNQTDTNLIQQTPFFIWSSDIESLEVEIVTSTIDILPTIANLFNLDYNPKYYIGSDALGNNPNNFVFFSDYSWYNGQTYYKNNQVVFGSTNKEEIEQINNTILEKISIGSGMALSDYYRSINIDAQSILKNEVGD